MKMKKINRYLLHPDELLIEKDDLEKIVENNYLYISSDSINEKLKGIQDIVLFQISLLIIIIKIHSQILRNFFLIHSISIYFLLKEMIIIKHSQIT